MILCTRKELLDTGREFYLTTGQVALVLEIGTTTVKRLETTGRLRALKNRRGWRYFNAGDVFDFMEERDSET
ncbi:helix-turn-helix domain-containing protein [Nocardiopsis ganjiahuensis]|uniref:helix-turn-helix domain-containing protein n=1 Tax=Nocardiopsis ganjiahuensis TaxID=239984 RepID=UPI000344B8E8|nr:helix-turn-helix domain-containing protein [Nocardiopsis ganjiahuensis]